MHWSYVFLALIHWLVFLLICFDISEHYYIVIDHVMIDQTLTDLSVAWQNLLNTSAAINNLRTYQKDIQNMKINQNMYMDIYAYIMS